MTQELYPEHRVYKWYWIEGQSVPNAAMEDVARERHSEAFSTPEAAATAAMDKMADNGTDEPYFTVFKFYYDDANEDAIIIDFCEETRELGDGDTYDQHMAFENRQGRYV